MDTVIKNYLEQMKVGRKQSHKNLALYPLLSTYNVGLEYLLLDEALSENLIEIVEKDSDGSVPELRVMNESPQMILILDGEELVGAKQNRIVNTTILVQGTLRMHCDDNNILKVHLEPQKEGCNFRL